MWVSDYEVWITEDLCPLPTLFILAICDITVTVKKVAQIQQC